MHSPGRFLAALLMVVFVFGGNGCSLSRGVRPPAPADNRPALPRALKAKEGKEPLLRVYLHETEEVEAMKMEEYIAGVVAAEMDPEWPREALAAQAIIARSFTLQKIGEMGGVPGRRGAHASTDIEEFQAYDATRINENVRRAVAGTRGEVLVYQGEFIRGWFHAYAGPRTALADEGLEFKEGNPPYIKMVDSPAREIVPAEERSWSASFSLEEVRDAVLEVTGADPGEVGEVQVCGRGPSGRATRIRINDREISAPALRLALGSTVFRSTFIESLAMEAGQLHLEGVGYGHGVGMCQWGARALAGEGWSCHDIPSYFYRDVELVKLWD